jgi:hypothetical protein
MNNSNTEIPLDRKKLVRIFVALVAFIVIGALGTMSSFSLQNDSVVEILGTISLVMYSLGIGLFFVYLAEAKKKGPGLLINADGITESASVECVGFIPWSDITGFKDAHEFNQKYIGVIVKNPKDYINKQSMFKRRVMWNNYKMKGVVISIPLSRLQTTYEELKTLLEQKLAEYKK